MLPSLRPGDQIVWRRLDGTTFPPLGSVVGYQSDHRFIAHRVLRVDCSRRLVWTRPDAGFQHDPPVHLDDITWLAVELRRDGRSLPLTPPHALARLLTCSLTVPARLAMRLARSALRRIGY